MSHSKLLIDEHPLQVIPSLAGAIGLNEAIFVQQLHYWLRSGSGQEIIGDDGVSRRWVHNTLEEWHEQFPFWSKNTVQRVIRASQEGGYVLASADHNRRGGDRTKWYTIDYGALESAQASHDAESHEQDGISHEQDPNLGSATPQDAVVQDPNLGSALPESPTETTSEKNPPPQSSSTNSSSSGHDPPGKPAREEVDEANADEANADEANADEDRDPLRSQGSRDEDLRVEKDEPTAADFVAILDEDLRGADPVLMDGRKARYGREFRQALQRGVSAEVLYRAADRIVERWCDDNNHYKLDLDQALGDIQRGRGKADAGAVGKAGYGVSHSEKRPGSRPLRRVTDEELGLA